MMFFVAGKSIRSMEEGLGGGCSEAGSPTVGSITGLCCR